MFDAGQRIGDIPAWIKRTNLPDDTVLVQCMNCAVLSQVCVTGFQAWLLAKDHTCHQDALLPDPRTVTDVPF